MCLFLLFVVLPFCFSVKGVDVSQQCFEQLGEDGFGCLKSSGYTYAIIRCYESGGRVDPNCPHTVYNAWGGGMSHVDIYVFPCHKCGNGKKQIEDTVNYMNSFHAKFGTLWLDIEGTQYWGSQSSNRAFFEELLEGVKSTGVTAGVYTSESQWEPIMGSYTGGSHLPLCKCYAHYDNNPSFSDFRAFGGWSKPAIKQYEGDKSLCGCGVDLNYYP